jgi:hypothetical protein
MLSYSGSSHALTGWVLSRTPRLSQAPAGMPWPKPRTSTARPVSGLGPPLIFRVMCSSIRPKWTPVSGARSGIGIPPASQDCRYDGACARAVRDRRSHLGAFGVTVDQAVQPLNGHVLGRMGAVKMVIVLVEIDHRSSVLGFRHFCPRSSLVNRSRKMASRSRRKAERMKCRERSTLQVSWSVTTGL